MYDVWFMMYGVRCMIGSIEMYDTSSNIFGCVAGSRERERAGGGGDGGER